MFACDKNLALCRWWSALLSEMINFVDCLIHVWLAKIEQGFIYPAYLTEPKLFLKNFSNSFASSEWLSRNPCIASHPSSSRAFLCSPSSTPSATTFNPRLRARPAVDFTIARSFSYNKIFFMKIRSINSVSRGNCPHARLMSEPRYPLSSGFRITTMGTCIRVTLTSTNSQRGIRGHQQWCRCLRNWLTVHWDQHV